MFSAATAMADTITLTDGSTLNGTVKAITTTDLEYTAPNSAVVRSVKLSRVFSVRYDNGEVETFTTAATAPAATSAAAGTAYGESREDLRQKELGYQQKFGKGNIKVSLGTGLAWQNIPAEDGYIGSDFLGAAIDFRAMYLHTVCNYRGDVGVGLGILYETGRLFDNDNGDFTYLTIPLSFTGRSHRWFYGMDLVPGFKISASAKADDGPSRSLGECANSFYLSYGIHGGVQLGKFDLGMSFAYRFTSLVKNGKTETDSDGGSYTLRGIKSGGSGFEFKINLAYRFKVL